MISDTTLLDGARRLDKHALTEIFERYARALYKYVLRLCRDAVMADDIVCSPGFWRICLPAKVPEPVYTPI
jgi:hypothetical protein